jgi:protease-4
MPPPGFLPPPIGFVPGPIGPGGPPFPTPFPAPPGFAPPGWPPPRKGGLGRALLTTFATTLFGFSLLLNVYLLLFSGLIGDKGSKEKTVQTGDPKQVVAVVPIVNSMILQAQAEQLDKMLKEVEADDNVKAVVLRIDTPGGEVTASDEMYHRILQFKQKRPGVPVLVSMGSLATSGGYYAACAADYLIAEPTTLTANIGVLSEGFNISKLADKWGIEDMTVHSTGADYKTAGSMMKPPTTQDTEYIQGLIDSMATQFHRVVTTGRQGRLKGPLPVIFNAKAYTADEALGLGLVDEIGYLDDACKIAATKAKLTNMTVVKYEEPSPLLSFLQGKSELSSPDATGSVKINGVTVQIPKLQRLLNPRPMYLYCPN